MNKLSLILPVLFFFLACQPEKETTVNSEPIPVPPSADLEVLMIGTFHFANFDPSNNMDVVSTNEVDVLSEKGQQELEQIAAAIEAYNPSKVFVEYSYKYQDYLDSVYRAFDKTDYAQLKRGEIVQLGFRIGKLLNHDRIYGIDYRNSVFPYGAMMETMEKANQTALIQKTEEDIKVYEEEYNAIVQKTQSIKEVLYYLNEEKHRQEDLGWYLNEANRAGTENDTVGSFLTAEWLRRNLMMYSYIQKQVTPKDERIMVLVGAGHAAAITNYIDYNPKWKTVELKEVIESFSSSAK